MKKRNEFNNIPQAQSERHSVNIIRLRHTPSSQVPGGLQSQAGAFAVL